MAMRKRRKGKPAGPALESVKLTPDEQRVFEEMIGDIAQSTDEETKRFLDGHRAESQGQ